MEVIHSRNHFSPLKNNTQRKKLLKLGRPRRARISEYATCLLPCFKHDYKKAGTVASLCQLLIRTCCRKCCSCLVGQRDSQRALNVSMGRHHSPFACNVYFFICTGNKAVYIMWLHRNDVYNIAPLEQLQNCGAQR